MTPSRTGTAHTKVIRLSLGFMVDPPGLDDVDGDGFDYVPHEPRAIPIRRRRLHLSGRVHCAHHKSPAARIGKAQGRFPLAEAVLAVILAKPGFDPALPLVV